MQPPMTVWELAPEPGVYAVSRDPRLRPRLLRQFDRGVSKLRGFFAERFGDDDLDVAVAQVRACPR
jgi:hypothetical protein